MMPRSLPDCEYRVDLQKLDDVTKRIAKFVENVVQNEAAIRESTEALKEAWTGEAAVQAAARFSRWSSEVGDMREGVSIMETAAHVAHTNYTEAVAVNLRMLGGG